MLTLFFLFFGVVISSGLCSMAEAAILSLPLMRARIMTEEKRKHSKDVLFLKEHITETIASIVIINNAINIVGSIFIGQMIAQRYGNQWLGIASTVLTFTIIIASEIIPKTIGERFKISISLHFARPLRIIVWFFRPLVMSLSQITRPFIKDAHLPKVSEEEIKMMLKLGRHAGTVEMDEEVLCNRVFKLNDLRAFQIMKPLDDVYMLPYDKTLGELREKIINSRFSRVVVCGKDQRHIVGVVQQRSLLREIANDNYSADVREFMTDPIFVNWFTKADALLERFQAYRQHLFIVQDTHGKNVGIVTMEDVLEELFGEIYDEKDIRPHKHIADIKLHGETEQQPLSTRKKENKEQKNFEI